ERHRVVPRHDGGEHLGRYSLFLGGVVDKRAVFGGEERGTVSEQRHRWSDSRKSKEIRTALPPRTERGKVRHRRRRTRKTTTPTGSGGRVYRKGLDAEQVRPCRGANDGAATRRSAINRGQLPEPGTSP